MRGYDLFCLYETWLDSTTSIDFNDLSFKGYNLHLVDDRDNFKIRGVCVYYKETLAAHFLQRKLDQYIVSSVVLITGDFNSRNSNWYLEHPVTPNGALVEALESFYDLYQLIKTSTHLLQNSAICIDLVFTDQSHLVMGNGVHSSLSSTCHRGIVFARLNLKVECAPPYERIFWDYSRVDFNKLSNY